jgi:hypothetical protein
MEYRVLRIAANSNGWLKPAPGRIGATDCGEFVAENGFGDEDWNFNVTRPIDGCIYGYARGAVAEGMWSREFSLLLVTYSKQDGWRVAGYYSGAKRVPDGTPLPDSVLRMRCEDVLELGRMGSLGLKYARRNADSLYKALHAEMQYHHWQVPTKNVFVCPDPVQIPSSIWKPNTWRMSVSHPIDRAKFKQLIAPAKFGALSASTEELATPGPDESDFPEGALKSRRHGYRERDSKLTRRAKAAFKASNNGRLFCQACGCDFQKKYGEDYIEAHHMVPVNQLDGKSGKTHINDLAMVCANCHRMLHRCRPWIAEKKNLPKVVLKNR